MPLKVIAPVIGSLVALSLGILVMAAYARGATTGGAARAQWTATPSTPEDVNAAALRAYAKANFGSQEAKAGMAAWWSSVVEFDVDGAYAVAVTTLEDSAKDIRHATEICVALTYFANDRSRTGTRLASVRVIGKDRLVLIDTTADMRETDPCQSFRSRPTRARG